MMKTKTSRARKVLGLLALSALGAGMQSAYALEFDGYFRVGPGGTKKDAARACYNLGSLGGGHYRLGNECDFYGEIGLAQTGTVDGVSYKAKVMLNEYNGGTDGGKAYNSFNQLYVEAKGFDISPSTNFWIGKRFYGRADVHIVDNFFTNLSGVGAGFDVPTGGGTQLGVAYFGDDGGNTGASKKPARRLNLDLSGIPVNPGGTLRIVGAFTQGNFGASAAGAPTYELDPTSGLIVQMPGTPATGKGTSGFSLTAQHNQDLKSLGGGNTFWLQYSQGSAGLDGNLGTATAGSDVKQWRIVESLGFQQGPVGGQAIAMYAQYKSTAVKYSEISVGGRVSYALTKNFKLVGEAGYMEHKPDGAPRQKLAKFTFAPTLSTGPGFWNRPELRAYITTAKWSSSAGDLAGLGNGKTNGTSYGLQAEVWF